MPFRCESSILLRKKQWHIYDLLPTISPFFFLLSRHRLILSSAYVFSLRPTRFRRQSTLLLEELERPFPKILRFLEEKLTNNNDKKKGLQVI